MNKTAVTVLIGLMLAVGSVNAYDAGLLEKKWQLVTSCQIPGKEGIWIVDVHGKNPRRLTSSAQDREPILSPDGRRVAYIVQNGGRNELWVMDSDGKNRRTLTDGTYLQGISWSPDGRQIALSMYETNAYHVYTVPLDGSGQKQLTTGRYEMYPSWSPDGKSIVYLAYDLSGRYMLAVTDVVGGRTREFPEAVKQSAQLYYAIPACWSPDSRNVLFTAYQTNGRIGGMYTMDLKTEKVTTLSESDVNLRVDQFRPVASWSPDGQSIAIQSSQGTVGARGEAWVQVMDLKSKKTKNVFRIR